MQDRDFHVKAAVLARAAPSQWSDFLAALKEYSDSITGHCIEAPTDKLQVAQGRAQMAREILRILRECKVTAERLSSKK
jgi:hypothetical protein